ncbi:MAG TPA: aminotransferase class I/II-fold pyridoxal phosphate-dependent enzyme [Candidatus Binatia bacterium]|jgi:8-amino-7-oxononanoate synthase
MALFDKFRPIADAREALAQLGADPFRATIEQIVSPTEAIVNGRPMILAGTNNYLGLTLDTQCIEAAVRALREQGTGTTGSRMANGSYSGHVALEKDLAEFYGRRWSVVFSTGYTANLGVISALTGTGDAILIDADCHASIYDGCRMSGAEIIRFRHNDVGDLDKRLRRLGERRGNALIIVEGIYSTLGDRAALADIAAVKKDHGACLLVDEAHSLGVLGEQGRGLSEESGVESSVDFIVGTFSKSLGATGGFCVSDHSEAELIRYGSRPYIFTASPCPAVIASTRAALNKLRSEPELRVRLWNNARQLYRSLQEMGFRLGPELSPVVAVRFEQREEAIALWNAIVEQGVYVNMILPPAAPDGGSLLRCSATAAHTPDQIVRICTAFATARAILS